MPLSSKEIFINKNRKKEVIEYLYRFINSNSDELYFYILYGSILKDVTFDGFYIQEDDSSSQCMIFQHTNTQLQDASQFINKNVLKFIIEKTPFFKEITHSSLNKKNMYVPQYESLQELYCQIPVTYKLILKNFTKDEQFMLDQTINRLFSLNQYVLGSNLIKMHPESV